MVVAALLPARPFFLHIICTWPAGPALPPAAAGMGPATPLLLSTAAAAAARAPASVPFPTALCSLARPSGPSVAPSAAAG